MSGMPRLDTAVSATAVVGMADQIMQGLHDSNDHQSDKACPCYVKAAIAGAINIGAYEMLKKHESLATVLEKEFLMKDSIMAIRKI
jgi:hypothetical protein